MLEFIGEERGSDREQEQEAGRAMGSKHGMERLEAGQKVHDRQNDTMGVVLEHACQYAHPKADPVYSYLIRWQDGQVQAVTETAFHDGSGLEVVD